RKLLQRKVNDIENDLRGQLRNFGLKVGTVRSSAFEQRVRELVADMPFVAAVVIPLLDARSALRAQLRGHRMACVPPAPRFHRDRGMERVSAASPDKKPL